MDTIDISEVFDDVNDSQMINESGPCGRLQNLLHDPKITFGEMRNIFKEVFRGQTTIEEKCEGYNMLVTYKDGGFRFARDKKDLKKPMEYSKVIKSFDGNPKVREAFVQSANDLGKALNSIEQEKLTKYFEDGKRYLGVNIVYPPARNLIDYGNRCLIQLNGLIDYDSKMNPITEDTEDSKEIYETLKANNALKQEMFEITKPNVLRIKNSVTAQEALDDVLGQLAKIVDGIGYSATIQDYANERLKRHIINCGIERGIDIDRNSTFCEELADRLSQLSHRRPTKSDIATYAKRAGLNPREENFRNFMNYLDSTSTDINEGIMKPIEDLIMSFGVLLFKNLIGFLAADPSKTSQGMVNDFEDAVNKIQNGSVGLTEEKMDVFKKNLKKIEKYGQKFAPTEGIIIRYNGRCYRISGVFPVLSSINGLLEYR